MAASAVSSARLASATACAPDKREAKGSLGIMRSPVISKGSAPSPYRSTSRPDCASMDQHQAHAELRRVALVVVAQRLAIAVEILHMQIAVHVGEPGIA